VLLGNYVARIDDKGRLKIPNAFRALVQKEHGSGLFVTSVTGESVRLYPMSVWKEIEEKLSRIPTTNPARQKFFDRVSYFGQVTAFDGQGRVHIHTRLRDSAGMTGEVDVLGQHQFLDVWNHERFLAKLQREPFNDDDARALSEFGI
jgi:MraZ protein